MKIKIEILEADNLNQYISIQNPYNLKRPNVATLEKSLEIDIKQNITYTLNMSEIPIFNMDKNWNTPYTTPERK
jgi:hypothetical protein